MRVRRNYQREQVIVGLRADGMTLEAIAERYGVSRQAIHRVCQRLKREAGGAAKTPVDPPAPQA